jgi:pullulanase/glycogen debranching enzyme
MNRNAEDEAAAGAAAGAADRTTCNEGTLHGTYAGANDGVVTEGDYKGPFAAAEFQWFDGNGKIEGVYSVNYNSRNSFRRDKFSGTYRVRADCTGTVTLTDGTEYDLYIDPDGSMFAWVQTDPPSMWCRGLNGG